MRREEIDNRRVYLAGCVLTGISSNGPLSEMLAKEEVDNSLKTGTVVALRCVQIADAVIDKLDSEPRE